MKKTIFTLFRILLLLVLISKVLNWFLKFDEVTNQVLNTAMFCLIGIAYLVMGYAWDKKIISVIIITCGLFLIIMNFLPDKTWITIIGIVCILFPMLITRFQKKENGNILIKN